MNIFDKLRCGVTTNTPEATIELAVALAPHLPDQAVLALDANTVHRVVRPYFDPERGVVVVSGDAKALAKPLSQVAPVVVLDPDKAFSITRTLPYSPLAADG